MSAHKKEQLKTRLHPRNRNREPYDLNALIKTTPTLEDYVKPNKSGLPSIDFSSPIAVKLLNKALLSYYYGIKYWEFPDENLCPPILGRADYIHYMADVLLESNFGRLPKGNVITCLDLGVGASCIYPIIGVLEYDWNFIGSDIDAKSIASAQKISSANISLKNKIDLRLQKSPKAFFQDILAPTELIDITVCNPPFHASLDDAQKGSRRKVKNLSGKKLSIPVLNFSGVKSELVYAGGELKFIQNMIWESRKYGKKCYWFSTLVSKQSNLRSIDNLLIKVSAKEVKTIPMGTGNKATRIVAWTFLSKAEQKEWRTVRWK